MVNMPNITKSQHYVPRFYLRTWKNQDGKIEVKLGQDKTFSSVPEGIAQENYFYQCPNLLCDEIFFVCSWMQKKGFPIDSIQKHITSSIFPNLLCPRINNYAPNDLNKIITLLAKNSWINQQEFYEYCHICNSMQARCNVDQTICETCPINKLIKEGEECVNSFVESEFLPYYNKCLENDTSFVCATEGFDVFSCYMVHQFFRTPKYMNLFNCSPNSRFDDEAWKRIRSLLRLPLISFVHNVIIQHKNDYVFKFINNPTSEEFLSGDQPIINLCSKIVDNAPAFFDLYFPLSPTMAIMLLKRVQLTSYPFLDNTLNIEDVQYLNKSLSSACSSQIYASNRNVLQHYYAGMS